MWPPILLDYLREELFCAFPKRRPSDNLLVDLSDYATVCGTLGTQLWWLGPFSGIARVDWSMQASFWKLFFLLPLWQFLLLISHLQSIAKKKINSSIIVTFNLGIKNQRIREGESSTTFIHFWMAEVSLFGFQCKVLQKTLNQSVAGGPQDYTNRAPALLKLRFWPRRGKNKPHPRMRRDKKGREKKKKGERKGSRQKEGKWNE